MNSKKSTDSKPPRRSLEGLRVLAVDDEPDVRQGLQLVLGLEGAQVRTAASAHEALDLIIHWQPHIVVSDYAMGRTSGLDLLDSIQREWPDIPLILITGQGTIPLAVQALKRGAAHFLTKPFDNHELISAVRSYGLRNLDNPTPLANHEIFEQAGIVSRSPAMHRILDTVAKVSKTRITTLILGESGTGKERVAKAIHQLSADRDRPFLALNTAALPDTLIESELFGHERGAFTGADSSREGLFVKANGGTVFLDEIGLMSSSFQSKLLRVLQENVVVPLGSSRPRPIQVRVIAATSSDLDALVTSGQFRKDLYFRINVVKIEIPKLSQRKEDIPALVEHFFSEFADLYGQGGIPKLSREVQSALESHSWPGNVRELENCVKRALVLAGGESLRVEHLGLHATHDSSSFDHIPDCSYEEGKQAAIRSFQRRFIERALTATNGNISHAARHCGMTRAAIQRIMRSLGLEAS